MRAVVGSDLELAHRLATAAGELALPFFRTRIAHEMKADGTPVSEVDVLVEQLLLGMLTAARPHDAIVTEESGASGAPEAARRWIIDPLDMTHLFIAGERGWATHIALEREGAVEIAVITRPTVHQRWWAHRGHGSFRSDGRAPMATSTRLRDSTTAALHEARVSGFAPADSRARITLSERAHWQSEELCIIGALAEGRLDVVVDDGGKVWDQAPEVLIVEEAGGTFCDRRAASASI